PGAGCRGRWSGRRNRRRYRRRGTGPAPAGWAKGRAWCGPPGSLDSRRHSSYYTTAMRNIIAISLIAGAILGVQPAGVRAREPVNQPPRKGRVLILENERTLTGDIEQVGEQFRVKRLVGETWVPGERVLRLCASLEDAHRFLQGRANLADPDERLRLA